MYTQCPECLFVFALDAPTVAHAQGRVICGHCGSGFDSLATLTELLPDTFQELPLNPQAPEPPRIEQVLLRPPPEAPETAAVDAPAEPEDPFAHLVFAPRFARERRSGRRRPPARAADAGPGERRWPWVIACLALTLLLAMQLIWAERNALIRNPLIGHWLRSSCAVLDCALPLVAAPGKIHLVASNVQAHPSAPGALMISASLHNDAAFAQPWPIVDITLSDAEGKPVGMRRLSPEEYLDDERALRRGLAPGATAVVVLELQDPGKQAVAFALSFE